MASVIDQILRDIASLDFTGKGEAFVEARFLTPLLMCLGYESHKDYEVIRHGDDGSSFKLHYPPVEAGAKRVKHYNPDYIPTIRKKMFWIIEAKSPKDVPYPFDANYLVQGLQYCIHPEIQAKYLAVTNGVHTAVYDAHGSVFLGRDIYVPVLEFTCADLVATWGEIFAMLSTDRLRDRIEADLKAMVDKLSLSSLDSNYPRQLLSRLGASVADNRKQVDAEVRSLYLASMQIESSSWQAEMEQHAPDDIFKLMDRPVRIGPKSEATYYVDKSLAAGIEPTQVYATLTEDFERSGVFRKIQDFVALAHLYRRAPSESLQAKCLEFFEANREATLSIKVQLECVMLRLAYKRAIVSQYSSLNEKLRAAIEHAPEVLRFATPPKALDLIYPWVIETNRSVSAMLMNIPEETLRHDLPRALQLESEIESQFQAALAQIPPDDRPIGGFQTYGTQGKLYQLSNILKNRGIIARDK